MAGGARRNSGRKKGSENPSTKAVRNILMKNRDKIIKRAVDLILTKKLDRTNTQVLCKLLDKVIPTLVSQKTDLSGSFNVNSNAFSGLTDEQLKERIAKFAKETKTTKS